MKKFQPGYLVIAALLLAVSCKNAPTSDEAKVSDTQQISQASGDGWKVNTSASKIRFIATKITAYHLGNLPVKSGTAQIKDSALTGGKLIIDMTGLAIIGPDGSDTAMNAKLQGHLKSPDFFDVTKFPEATFEITSVKPFTGTVPADGKENTHDTEISEYKVANPSHTISGNLTIKGITKNVEFPALVTIKNGVLNVVAKFNIDRAVWNITYPGKPDDLIRNQVNLGISLTASKND